MTTLHTIVAWHDARTENPSDGKGLLTVVKTGGKTYVDDSLHYWREQGIWVDPSGDPVEGVVLFWTYTQSIMPEEAK